VDRETRLKRQQQWMLELLERKIRARARQLYEERGGAEGRALEDWVRAESEVLSNNILAPLYRRTHSSGASRDI
jgi:hypothetical protein